MIPRRPHKIWRRMQAHHALEGSNWVQPPADRAKTWTWKITDHNQLRPSQEKPTHYQPNLLPRPSIAKTRLLQQNKIVKTPFSFFVRFLSQNFLGNQTAGEIGNWRDRIYQLRDAGGDGVGGKRSITGGHDDDVRVRVLWGCEYGSKNGSCLDLSFFQYAVSIPIFVPVPRIRTH